MQRSMMQDAEKQQDLLHSFSPVYIKKKQTFLMKASMHLD